MTVSILILLGGRRDDGSARVALLTKTFEQADFSSQRENLGRRAEWRIR
jgi:hypothetical protein